MPEDLEAYYGLPKEVVFLQAVCTVKSATQFLPRIQAQTG